LAGKVTQYILYASHYLDHGLTLNNSSARAATSHMASIPVPSTTYNTNSSSSFCHSYYQYMSQTAAEHHQQQTDYEQNYVHKTSHVVERRKHNFLQTFLTGVNPQLGKRRQWLKQTNNDKVANSKAYELASYKYYRVTFLLYLQKLLTQIVISSC